jgi:outer membrane lipoprotein SlyB
MRKFFEKYGMPLLALLMMASFSVAQYGQSSGYTAPPTSFTGPITPTVGTHLQLNAGPTNTDQAGETVRIDSITNTGTANSWIGFQSKPGQGTTMANPVMGFEVSPRLNDGVALTGASGTIIGGHIDTYLRGTTGNVAGDVRGEQIELITDDGGSRVVTGDVVGLRMRAAFSGTVTGHVVPFRIEFAENQTNSVDWEALMKLTGTQAGVWNDDPATEVDATTVKGYVKLLVNGQVRYIALYDQAPVD